VSSVDRERIEAAVSEILAAIGDDPAREGLAQTPRRVADLFAELYGGVGVDPASAIGSTFTAPDAQPVILRDITFRSVCEHHLMVFEGVAHVAYLPGERIAGLGGIVAVIESASSRPQLQERLGDEIAAAIESALDSPGVLVVLDAKHGCVSARGPRQTRSTTVTLASRGVFTDPAARAEVIALIGTGSGTVPSAGLQDAPGEGR